MGIQPFPTGIFVIPRNLTTANTEKTDGFQAENLQQVPRLEEPDFYSRPTRGHQSCKLGNIQHQLCTKKSCHLRLRHSLLSLAFPFQRLRPELREPTADVTRTRELLVPVELRIRVSVLLIVIGQYGGDFLKVPNHSFYMPSDIHQTGLVLLKIFHWILILFRFRFFPLNE